jgi:hypothetical protein
MWVVCSSWIIVVWIWHVAEQLSVNHLFRHILSKGVDLSMNVSEEGIAGPVAKEHDFEVHGHGQG